MKGDGEEIEKAIQEGMQVKQWEKLLSSEQLRGFSCVLTSLPILAANFLLPSEILSQKHRNDLVIKHICLNHTIVSSPNLYAFVNLLPCLGLREEADCGYLCEGCK